MRARLAAAHVEDASVTVSGDRVLIAAAGDARQTREMIAALSDPGRLAIYDWATSVIGADGKPSPGDAAVTGGAAAGLHGAMSRYEAVLRAAKHRGSDPGTATFWLVDDARRRVLDGSATIRDKLQRAAPFTQRRTVTAPPGTRIVRAREARERWCDRGQARTDRQRHPTRRDDA